MIFNKITKIFMKHTKDEINKEIKRRDEEFLKKAKNSLTSNLNQYEEDITIVPSNEVMGGIDYSLILEPTVINPSGAKSLLIVDDIEFTDILYEADYKRISANLNKNVKEDFKIIKCYGSDAGYQAYKYAILNGNKIDKAILDITLGHSIKLATGEILELDGIDLAVMLKYKYPDIKFLLCTAHTLNLNNIIMTRYNNKLRNNLNIYLEDVYLSKNTDRVKHIYNLLYGELP